MNRANKEIGRKENREHIAAENGILFREDKEANQTNKDTPVYGKSQPR